MVIFHSYVSLPEGIHPIHPLWIVTHYLVSELWAVCKSPEATAPEGSAASSAFQHMGFLPKQGSSTWFSTFEWKSWENHGKIMGKWMNFVIKYLRAIRVDFQTPTCWDLYFCHQKKSLDHPIEVKIPHWNHDKWYKWIMNDKKTQSLTWSDHDLSWIMNDKKTQS